MEKEQLNTFDKELLLKDLCARLPYGVKVRCDFGLDGEITEISRTKNNLYYCKYLDCKEGYCYIESLKPYLFPLSSMTDEQRQEYTYIVNYISPDDTDNWKEGEFIYVEQFTQLMHFYHKNHLDYRGLITMGLATDATGLNIY